MLEQVLDYIHNYFEKRKIWGVFSVVNGTLDGATFLQDGQYYKVKGSVFNDGVWCFGSETNMKDETFMGEVWALAIPPRLVSLADEIEEWLTVNREVVMSPFQSESFAGYSYTKASGGGSGSGNGENGGSWQSVFGSQLNQWRKIS